MRHPIDPLLKEAGAALVASVLLGSLVSGLFWLLTGISPWPMVVIGAIGGFGFGLAMLALLSPSRER
ncbi:MAG: hypothetical protein U0821_21090 [Chloroflexota bacterium]